MSLKKLGLRIANLNCSAGGPHHVPTDAVVIAAAAKGGKAVCLKCAETVTLVSA